MTENEHRRRAHLQFVLDQSLLKAALNFVDQDHDRLFILGNSPLLGQVLFTTILCIVEVYIIIYIYLV